MLTLASYRFRNVFEKHGGPISRLETSESEIAKRRVFQANAYLRTELVPQRTAKVLYGDADGTGTASSPLVARHVAVSEALERWAYHTCIRLNDRTRFGLSADPSSTGFAAFPGVWERQARRSAYFEAVERHSTLCWWEGQIGAVERRTPWPGVTSWVIWDAPGEVAVILHKHCDAGFHVYGRAAAPTFDDACRHAHVELARREYVSRAYWLAHARSFTTPPAATGLLERRSLFFSSPEGYECCRLRLALQPMRRPPRRKLVFDGPIRGPWSTYADVWRVLFEPPSQAFLSNDVHYFMI